LVIDPGSPYGDEQAALANNVAALVAEGRRVKEIVLTHVHPDHVGGVNALREQLGEVSVAAHRLTAEPLTGTVQVDRLIEDNDVIELNGSPEIRLQAMHTPGHARGHLCLYEARTGTLISGDNIVGLGSVLIEPGEGNMRDYLRSLERMKQLPNLSVIFGGHGPAMGNPYQKIDEYISHRLEREQNILRAVSEGAATVKDIVARVYTDVSPKAHPMAERAVLAHLEKLIEDGAISRDSVS
jgi:glyoxylase-like metal-dependent hydrolase (beta-lactamase superfamily II)